MIINIRKYIILLIFSPKVGFLLFSFFIIFQLKSQLLFDHYSVEDGLSQTVVNCIFQDNDRFLWIGTQDGLNRFDGSRFNKYYNSPYDINSISDNYIYIISKEPNGCLWIGTRYGLNKYNPLTDNFIRFLQNPNKPASIYDDEVLGIYIDKDNTKWINTFYALSKFNDSTGTFEHFIHSNPDILHPDLHYGYPVTETGDGYILAGTYDGLCVFDKKSMTINKYPVIINDTEKLSVAITSIVFDTFGNIWVGTECGLFLFDIKSKLFKEITLSNTLNNNNKGLNIKSILIDHSGIIWIATYGDGLFQSTRTFYKGWIPEFINYRSLKGDNTSLMDNQLTYLFEDRTEVLWLGTYNTGIIKLDLKKKKFRLYNNFI
ncbi:MAG: hypothetical protein HY738_24570 [Bacteroidia bacterium]|nr:hypothetical protein [Bacteroidia bacterium]